ncbi:hypothetical protein PMAYCL1PPCAC_09908, partial [Pristionchus mayeri]
IDQCFENPESSSTAVALAGIIILMVCFIAVYVPFWKLIDLLTKNTPSEEQKDEEVTEQIKDNSIDQTTINEQKNTGGENF